MAPTQTNISGIDLLPQKIPRLDWDTPCTPRTILSGGLPTKAAAARHCGARRTTQALTLLAATQPKRSRRKTAVKHVIDFKAPRQPVTIRHHRPLHQSVLIRNEMKVKLERSPKLHQSKIGVIKPVPWRIYTDPMRQTSKHAPNFDVKPSVNFKGDLNIDQGNVISPVPLIVLPLGSVVEVACEYFKETEER